jgi:drug/metabolite transporter (DMT)-like permease
VHLCSRLHLLHDKHRFLFLIVIILLHQLFDFLFFHGVKLHCIERRSVSIIILARHEHFRLWAVDRAGARGNRGLSLCEGKEALTPIGYYLLLFAVLAMVAFIATTNLSATSGTAQAPNQTVIVILAILFALLGAIEFGRRRRGRR